jgi:acetolactate decarboxylase
MASITIVTLSVFAMSFQQTQLRDDEVLFQASSLDSLLKGSYEGKMTVDDLLDHGDFGLGALEYMDGELVCLDAACYQVRVDGVPHKLSPEAKVAFAAVVFFQPDKTLDIDQQQNFTELQKYLDGEIESNSIYAIQINGFFSDITTRSVPKQDKLYVPLSDVVANQTVFNLSNVKGTLVGFYIPDYMKEINVAKYHFHFVTDDVKSGGHLLGMNMVNGTIKISKINEVQIIP